MASKLQKIRGIFPPICTPFTKSGDIDYKSLQHNLSKLSSTKIAGLVVNGSNGEFAQLSEKERVDLVGKARELFNDSDRSIIAGSGCESTNQTIEMTNDMADVGADVGLVITPSYYKSAMGEAHFLNHFRRVADGSKIPIVLYNVPKFTNVELETNVIIELAKHENIIGIKQSDGNAVKYTEQIISSTDRATFGMISGSVGFMKKQADLGAVGCIGAVVNMLPNHSCRVLDAETSQEQALILESALGKIHNSICAEHGVPGLKYAMELLDYKGGACREPLLGLASREQIKIQQILDDFHTVHGDE